MQAIASRVLRASSKQRRQQLLPESQQDGLKPLQQTRARSLIFMAIRWSASALSDRRSREMSTR